MSPRRRRRRHPITPHPTLGVVLFAIAASLLGFGCSTPGTQLIGELDPIATVASNDGFVLEETDTGQAEDAPQKPANAESSDEALHHNVQLVLPKTTTEPTARLVVQTHPLHTTRLKLTPLTLGEALFYQRGENINSAGAQYEFKADADTHESSLDLSHLATYSTLLALDAHILDATGDVVEEHHELLQLNPFLTSTSHNNDDNALSLQLRERFANTPIANAEITLLDRDGRRLARSLTNRQGNAELRALEAPTFVAIRTAQHLALLPFPSP